MTARLIAVLALVVLIQACVRFVPEPVRRSLSFDERMELGRIYESRGETGLALKEYRGAAALSRRSPLPYFSMGNVYLAAGIYIEAKENFNKAIDMDPTVGVFYNNLAWAHLETESYLEAEHWAQTGLTMDTNQPYIYMDTLGVVYTRTGSYEAAEKRLVEALVFAPVIDVRALYHIRTHLLDLYIRTKDDKKADGERDELEMLRVRWPGPGPPPPPPIKRK